MKRSIVVGMALVGALSAKASAAGPARDSRFSDEKLILIEANLVAGLSDADRPTLQASAAGVLRQVKEYAPEYDFSSAVIPLMAIVKDESKDEPARILAALALHSLHSGRGDYAIKTTAWFTGNERVKKICSALAFEGVK